MEFTPRRLLSLFTVLVALGCSTPSGPAELQELVTRLRDGDADTRESAAESLGKLGPRAAPAIPALARSLTDPELVVRLAVAQALGEIGPASVPALIQVLKETEPRPDREDKPVDPLAFPASTPESNAREAAAIALGHLGPAASSAVPFLIVALTDKDSGVRAHSIMALGRIQSKAALPALRKLLMNEDAYEQQLAFEAIEEIR